MSGLTPNFQYIIIGLNPYSTGRYSMSNKGEMVNNSNSSLNPYSTGRYSMRDFPKR